MMARLEPLSQWRKAETLNQWTEAVPAWERVGTVRCVISAGTGGGLRQTNDLARIDSTHTAVTWDAVKVGDRLRDVDDDGSGTGWEVQYVIGGGRRRMHQLFLKREDEAR